MENDLGFSVGTDSDGGEIGEELLSSLMGETSDQSREYYIVKTDEINLGDFFNGLVYVRQSFNRQNRMERDKYDLKLQCVDGNGKVFEMTIFKTEQKVELNNQVAYVTEGQKVPAHGKVFYNATSIRLQTGSSYPTSAFLKYIEGISEYKDRYKEIITDMCEEVKYKKVFDLLEERLNISTKLASSSYPHKDGGKIGEFLKVYVEVNHLYKQWGTSIQNKSEEDLRFFALLSLTSLTQEIIREYSQFNDKNFYEEVDIRKEMALEPYMIQILYSVGLKEEELGIITQTIVELRSFRNTKRVELASTFQMEFLSCLQMIEQKLKIDNLD